MKAHVCRYVLATTVIKHKATLYTLHWRISRMALANVALANCKWHLDSKSTLKRRHWLSQNICHDQSSSACQLSSLATPVTSSTLSICMHAAKFNHSVNDSLIQKRFHASWGNGRLTQKLTQIACHCLKTSNCVISAHKNSWTFSICHSKSRGQSQSPYSECPWNALS